MMVSLAFNLAAVASMLPAALLPLRRSIARDVAFWALLGLAVAGPVLWAAWQLTDSWRTNLSADLWVGIAASQVLFAVVCSVHRQAWRLTPLLMPYLILLGLFACLFASAPGQPMAETAPSGWLDSHILLSVATLGLLTVAASAAVATFLQAAALKNKRPNRLTRMLPAVNDSERLFERLLLLSEAILGLGVLTGMATQFAESGSLLSLTHKTLLSLLAFAIIGALLIGRRVCGVRGQLAVRVVLVAYTLVILGYFGVKFVKQVLLS
jgi:ABC-type uncharacterized transport system permease subunit